MRPGTTRHTRRGCLTLAALAAAGFAATGCGKTVIDDQKTAAAIQQNLQGQLDARVTSVSCPDNQEIESGATFECRVDTANGGVVARLRILNEDADVRIVAIEDASESGPEGADAEN